MTLKKIKSMIKELCKGADDFWKNHILLVSKYSKILGNKLDADLEVLEIASYLHDIKKIKKEKGDHHVHGSIEAEKILIKLKYPANKIKRVKLCILTHSSDIKYKPKSKEERIFACADSLSIFDDFVGLIYFKFNTKKLDSVQAKKWLKNKYKDAWEKVQLLKEAEKIAKPKYDTIKLILE